MDSTTPNPTLHKLQERIKELTALHQTARLLQNDDRPEHELVQDVVSVIPSAWQYPEIAVARISCGALVVSSPGYQTSNWSQVSSFRVGPHVEGKVEVCYLEERPPADEGPFLAEERDLIDSLADLLRSYFQHKQSAAEIRAANDGLERLVVERTRDLRRLATELSLAEARKDRELAADLHDHVMQEFAFIKLRIMQFRGDAVFCGFEQRFDEIIALVERAIKFTRRMSFELSTPMLYELGLVAALEWLGEQVSQRHNVVVHVHQGTAGADASLPEALRITLFRGVQELLTNAVKHAAARSLDVTVQRHSGAVEVIVKDNGRGFDSDSALRNATASSGFGLFSIRERLRHFGGALTVHSIIGTGTTIAMRVPLEQA
ncbi:MAG: sensor histidine kinase [bacterium]|nr:sensor histidine kinase [bacterium]